MARPNRVISMRYGSAKETQYAVTHKTGDCTSVLFDRSNKNAECRIHDCGHILRIQTFGEGRGIDNIGKEGRNKLAFTLDAVLPRDDLLNVMLGPKAMQSR